jgi:hypothetical protein
VYVAIQPIASEYSTWQYIHIAAMLVQCIYILMQCTITWQKKAIVMIWVVATIIDCNVSLHGNNHDYCNNIQKSLQSAIAMLLLATIFNQSHIFAIERYYNKYGHIAIIFHCGNRPIF